jgi:MOSC domain-containing protein YiiM
MADGIPDLRELTRQFSVAGRVEAIILRPQRNAPARSVASAVALADRGLDGDRSAAGTRTAGSTSKRQVTLFQFEHLPLVAKWSARDAVDPKELRRNLVISGINLISTRSPFSDQPLRLHVGAEVVLLITGPCDPCSKMEAVLGPGAYNALRGHGGMTSRVLEGGLVQIGDTVRMASGDSDHPPSRRA